MKYLFRRPARSRTLLILAAAYIIGAGAGNLYSFLRSEQKTVQTSSSSTSWGLSFQDEGKRPVGNASVEELAQYDAYFAEDTEEKVLYLTFDCGYENGNMPAILDALKKHRVPAAFFVVGNFIKDNPELIKHMVQEGTSLEITLSPTRICRPSLLWKLFRKSLPESKSCMKI